MRTPQCPAGMDHNLMRGTYTLYRKTTAAKKRYWLSEAIVCYKCEGIWLKRSEDWEFYKLTGKKKTRISGDKPE